MTWEQFCVITSICTMPVFAQYMPSVLVCTEGIYYLGTQVATPWACNPPQCRTVIMTKLLPEDFLAVGGDVDTAGQGGGRGMAAAREVIGGDGGAVRLVGGGKGGDAAWGGVVSGGEFGSVVQSVGGFQVCERNAQAGFGGEVGGYGEGEGASTVEVVIGRGGVVREERIVRALAVGVGEEYAREGEGGVVGHPKFYFCCSVERCAGGGRELGG